MGSQMPDINAQDLEVLLTRRRNLHPSQVRELLERIRPVVRLARRLYYIKPVDPFNVSFIHRPQPIAQASSLRECSTIYTLHAYGSNYKYFAPTLSEVVCMIPLSMLPRVAAFETHGPTDMADIRRQRDAVNAGYHVAVTILYEAA